MCPGKYAGAKVAIETLQTSTSVPVTDARRFPSGTLLRHGRVSPLIARDLFSDVCRSF